MATKESEEQQIIEEDVENNMDFVYDILEVLQRWGVTKDQRLDCYWYLVTGEYCVLMHNSDWTKKMVMEDVDKHRNLLEGQVDTIISQAERIKQLAEENKTKILNRRPTYVG